MAYYFVGFDSSAFDRFVKAFSPLGKGERISEKTHLQKTLGIPQGDAVFFFYLKKSSPELDELAMLIRAGAPQGKIIYVVDQLGTQELKAHQSSSVGGDAYIPLSFEAEVLSEILAGLEKVEINPKGNRLEEATLSAKEALDFEGLEDLKEHALSRKIDSIFDSVLKSKDKKPMLQSIESFSASAIILDDLGEDMSDKDQELSLDDLGDLELSEDNSQPEAEALDEGLELSFDSGADLDLSDGAEESPATEDTGLDLSLDADEDLSLSFDDGSEDEPAAEVDELSLDSGDDELSLGDEDLGLSADEELSLGGEESVELSDDSLSFGGDDDLSLDLSAGEEMELGGSDFSDDAKEKLKEIDAIMDLDASQVGITPDLGALDDDLSLDSGSSSLDEPLVSDDLNLDNLNFSSDDEPAAVQVAPKEEKPKRKKKEEKEERDLGQDLKEISGAYSGEMERMQATISNLRLDREELLAKIQRMEDDRTLHNRSTLSMRAELDEKKIELSIIRKKLNDEIYELKDRLKFFDEKRLILEEKNKALMQELDKASQKNKIDLKKVQLRERELEQKLELLKSDAETQIRNRDLKILELKRKVDAMEFDMESITQQEKRSVESRFELEDKLDKAIKTLRSAINVLENESDRGNALDALKKNLDV